MTNIWSYRDDVGTGVDTTDFVGYDVEASDGRIGSIDEASNEAGGSFLVVDTGFWIFGKKRMVPAGVVERIDHDDRRVIVQMTKDEIKSAPDFDESHRLDRGDDYDNCYQPYGW